MAEPATGTTVVETQNEVHAATRRLKWGVLGTGRIARTLLRALRDADGVEAYAVASRDIPKAQDMAREFGVPKAYSYDGLLRDPEVEVVYNSLPNGLHAQWSIKAARAGKHVLCEKPLAVTVREADRMIEAARDNNVLLMEAFMYRFHAQWARVAEIVREGDIGDVRFARAAFSFVMNNPDDIRYDPRLGPGALMDVGCYCINFLRFAAGIQNPGAEPEAVLAAAHFRDEDRKIDETVAGTLRFPNDVLGQFVCSFRMSGGAMAEIVGSKGRIEIPNPWLPGNTTQLVIASGGETRTEEVAGSDNYVAEVEHFSRCVMSGTPLLLPPSDARANMAVIEALRKSARSGREVRLAPQ